MSTDSMPILPETDPASDRWAIQDSNGGKCLQDMSSEVVFESIRISKCLLNESTDSRCGDKPALKMKIVLAEKKDKSEISPNTPRVHEDDEDTDIVEDESDSSSELTIVDDSKADKPPTDQEQVKRKSPKEGRRKRKSKETQEPKSHAMKKRREEREAEKRRAEEIFKTQENEAMAKRIQMEFSNLRRFRNQASGDSSPKTDSNPTSDPRTPRSDVSSKPPARESSPAAADPMPPKSSTEKSACSTRSLESVSVVIPSNENLRTMTRNGSVSSLTSQCDTSCFDKLKSDRKESFLASSTPSPGKHHIPIGLPPAPSTLHSTLSSSHPSSGSTKRESPRQSPRNSPETSPIVLPDQMNSNVTIDLASSPEPPKTIVCTNASYCPGPPPPTIHIPGPLCLVEQQTPKLRESPSESLSESGQNRGSPQVHVSSQSELSIATRTSPPSLYSTPAPLTVEVPLPADFQTSSNRSQPPVSPHSRPRDQILLRNCAINTEGIQAGERQTKLKTSTVTDIEKLSNPVFNPKFSAFSVDNLTKIDIRAREKSRSSPSDLAKESPRKTQAAFELALPSGALQEKQTTARVVEDPNSSGEKVRVIRQSEFEFARPQAAPRKSRLKTSSPPPLSSSGSVPSSYGASTPGSINGHNPESKSALIWRYIQDQSGGSAMQTIDSALESVRASSNCLKQDDTSTILANYLQGQRKEGSSEEVARDRTLPERSTSPDPVLQSRDPRSLYLTKLKKMLVTLQKFSTTISMEVGKAVYHNIYALASGTNNVEEFIAKTQRATKLALKPYVGPFLASYLPLLQKEITVKAASVRMSSSRYMRSNPECLIDPAVEPGDPHEVFVSEFDIPNKKKSLPPPPPPPLPGPNMMIAQVPVQNAAADHLANAAVSLEMQDLDPRYRTHLTIQNDLMLIQEMLDRISKMVESTKRTLSTLQEESATPASRDNFAQCSPCCSPVVSSHVPPPPSALSPKDLATSLARLENFSNSPPRYSSNAQNFSSCNAQQKSSNYLQNAIMASRPAASELPRSGLVNQTQKDGMMRHDMRNQQAAHSMPHAASPPYAIRPLTEQSSSSMHKDTTLNSNPNTPMAAASVGYGPPDVLVSRNELLQKELAASNHRESIPVLSSSTVPSFPASTAADKKYQDSLRLKSSTNVISKNPVNLSSPQRLTSQPANIGDPECCWNCGRSAQETCSGCKLAKYCGLFCQHRDWEIHHRVCRVIGTNSPKSPNSN